MWFNWDKPEYAKAGADIELGYEIEGTQPDWECDSVDLDQELRAVGIYVPEEVPTISQAECC